MVLDWLAKGKAAGLPEIVARKQFGKAVELAQAQHDAQPRDGRLRLQLADTLVAAGRGREAVPLLREMADDLAAEGFAAKAIALLKRIQKIDPGRMDIERRLASLIADRARRDTAAPRPPVPTAAPDLPEFGMEEIGEGELDLQAPPRPVLRAPALFPDFSDEELVAVMGGLRLVEFEAGDLVVCEGEPGDSLFLVTTGTVKAWMRNREGRYVLVRRLGEGDFFGEISMLTGSPRTATVVAASPCEMLELDRTTLDGITAAHPRVREVLERFYEQRVATTADAPSPGAA
ncbi:MAG TPA: cyclic nucleotide-binding domain-containing protein [Vicinamibacteria bacterium]|nr:cyclic nucleotide-binding domain-containing protein [Vicinamibacteria bacterium]